MSTPELLGAEVAHDEWILRCLFLSGIVILAYDHVLTFGSEVKYIWTSGRRRSAVWYLFVRYLALSGNMVMITVTFGTLDSKTCYKLTVAHGILLIVQELFVGCTLIMRVLAMYGFDKRVVITLVFAEILQLAVGTWALVPHGPPPPDDSPLPGCHTPNSRAQDMRMVVAWESQLAGDLILLGFTLYSGYTRSRGAIFPPGSLLRVLVRDGTMYFGIICIANFANTIMYYLDDIHTSSSLSALTVSLSVTMVCRLMLNLHAAAARPVQLSEFSKPPTQIRFASPAADSQSVIIVGAQSRSGHITY